MKPTRGNSSPTWCNPPVSDRAARHSTEPRGVVVPDVRDQRCDMPDRQNERLSDPLETPRLADADGGPSRTVPAASHGTELVADVGRSVPCVQRAWRRPERASRSASRRTERSRDGRRASRLSDAPVHGPREVQLGGALMNIGEALTAAVCPIQDTSRMMFNWAERGRGRGRWTRPGPCGNTGTPSTPAPWPT